MKYLDVLKISRIGVMLCLGGIFLIYPLFFILPILGYGDELLNVGLTLLVVFLTIAIFVFKVIMMRFNREPKKEVKQ